MPLYEGAFFRAEHSRSFAGEQAIETRGSVASVTELFWCLCGLQRVAPGALNVTVEKLSDGGDRARGRYPSSSPFGSSNRVLLAAHCVAGVLAAAVAVEDDAGEPGGAAIDAATAARKTP